MGSDHGNIVSTTSSDMATYRMPACVVTMATYRVLSGVLGAVHVEVSVELLLAARVADVPVRVAYVDGLVAIVLHHLWLRTGPTKILRVHETSFVGGKKNLSFLVQNTHLRREYREETKMYHKCPYDSKPHPLFCDHTHSMSSQ